VTSRLAIVTANDGLDPSSIAPAVGEPAQTAVEPTQNDVPTGVAQAATLGPDSLEAALAARDDLNRYKSAKRSLYALQLSLDIEDIHTVAASALTDGPDDKSCDVVFVDRDSGRIVIIQGYEAGAADKLQAPLGKASTLHQAVNWLLATEDEAHLPERLKSSWKEIGDAISEGAVNSVEIWFVHNLPEAKQIEDELNQVAQAANRHIKQRFPDSQVDVSAIEVGRTELTSRYEGSRTPILVSDTLTIPGATSFEESGDNWSALCTSVPATWLRDQFNLHGQRLFSANIRGYLGSTRSQNNINNGIRSTATDTPRRFWAYNNGITALVHGFESTPEGVIINGVAIVNGAQTTGAISSAADSGELGDARVMARFIKCDDPETVREIIRYNNRQNPTQAADFRSNDRIQTRLVAEFEALGVIGYNGGRRGGVEDVIRRPGENQISATVAAQALAAFHGRPDTAYHEKGQIWEEDATYSTVFPERVSAGHIIFVFSLLKAVEAAKTANLAIPEGLLTQEQRDLRKWFALRGATFLAVAAVGSAMEIVLDRAVADKYGLQFVRAKSVTAAVEAWAPVVQAVLSFAAGQLSSPLSSGGLRARGPVAEALIALRGILSATKVANKPLYEAFAKEVVVR
jgi:hypothetical protein